MLQVYTLKTGAVFNYYQAASSLQASWNVYGGSE